MGYDSTKPNQTSVFHTPLVSGELGFVFSRQSAVWRVGPCDLCVVSPVAFQAVLNPRWDFWLKTSRWNF